MQEEFIAPPSSYSIGGNFDPNSVDSDRVVLLSLVLDASPSTRGFADDFNRAIKEWLKSEQDSHIAEEIYFQIVSFGSDVTIDLGWQPLVGFDATKDLFETRPFGHLTAGYDAVRVAFDSMNAYGTKLEQNGTDVRYNLCLMTDGDFNDGNDQNGRTVVEVLEPIRRDESKYGRYTVFLYGVGQDVDFEKAAKNMTFDPNAILRYGATGSDFKKMLTSVSQSVSKSLSGKTTPNF